MRPLAGNSGTCEDESFLTEGQEIMTAAASENVRNHAAFIWSVADLLRGDYKQSEYGRVILPMVVLRRLDCVLEPTKEKVLKRLEQLTGRLTNVEKVLCQAAGQQFYNVSPLSMTRLLDDPNHIADNLRSYVLAFSPGATDVLQKFDLLTQIDRLDRADLLLSGCLAVLRHRSAPRQCLQSGDGLPLRGAGPSILRAFQRDGR
jgi:hypothetical protein